MRARSPGLPSLALGLLLMAVASLLLAGPALGHSYLNSSNPKDGQTLKQAPAQVTLVFSDTVRDTGLGVAAQGPEGGFPLAATAKDKTVIAEWPSESPQGNYTVSYRAVSSDGHVMDGSISFQIAGTKAVPSPAAVATPELYSSPNSEENLPNSEEDPTSSEEPGTTTTGSDKAPEGVPPWVFFLGALIAAGGIVAGVLRGRSKDQ